MTIADHPFSLCQRGFNHRLDQLNARRIKHQHFRFVSDNLVANGFDIQHQAAQFFRQLRTARLTGEDHLGDAKRFKRINHHVTGGGFPAPSSPSMTMYLLRIFSLSAFR